MKLLLAAMSLNWVDDVYFTIYKDTNILAFNKDYERFFIIPFKTEFVFDKIGSYRNNDHLPLKYYSHFKNNYQDTPDGYQIVYNMAFDRRVIGVIDIRIFGNFPFNNELVHLTVYIGNEKPSLQWEGKISERVEMIYDEDYFNPTRVQQIVNQIKGDKLFLKNLKAELLTDVMDFLKAKDEEYDTNLSKQLANHLNLDNK